VQQKRNEDQRVVHPGDRSLSAISGLDGTQGSLAPRGAVVKVAGMADLKFAEPARFDGEEARFRTVKNKNYREGEVLVIRSERLQRGLGMREALSTGDTVALLFCKRFSTTTCESAAGAIGQDATAGACHALV
jgi:dihydroxy-acid dehydratase